MAIYRITLYPTQTDPNATSFNLDATDLSDADSQVSSLLETAGVDRVLIEDTTANTAATLMIDSIDGYGIASAGEGAQTDVVHVEDDRIRITAS